MYYSLRSKLFVVYLSKYACAREYIKCGYRPGMSYFRSPVIVHFINGSYIFEVSHIFAKMLILK
jgi:hypothetical protein